MKNHRTMMSKYATKNLSIVLSDKFKNDYFTTTRKYII